MLFYLYFFDFGWNNFPYWEYVCVLTYLKPTFARIPRYARGVEIIALGGHEKKEPGRRGKAIHGAGLAGLDGKYEYLYKCVCVYYHTEARSPRRFCP